MSTASCIYFSTLKRFISLLTTLSLSRKPRFSGRRSISTIVWHDQAFISKLQEGPQRRPSELGNGLGENRQLIKHRTT